MEDGTIAQMRESDTKPSAHIFTPRVDHIRVCRVGISENLKGLLATNELPRTIKFLLCTSCLKPYLEQQ